MGFDSNEDWQPEKMPALVIANLGRMITKASDDALRQVGITASQLPVLVSLKNGERRTQIELARIAGVEQPSMAQLLTRMEREGLIQREPSPDDRRSSLISLTPLAIERLEPGRRVLREVDRGAQMGLSASETELLLGLLARLGANLAEKD